MAIVTDTTGNALIVNILSYAALGLLCIILVLFVANVILPANGVWRFVALVIFIIRTLARRALCHL